MRIYGLDQSPQLDADLDIQPFVSQCVQIYGGVKGRQGSKNNPSKGLQDVFEKVQNAIAFPGPHLETTKERY